MDEINRVTKHGDYQRYENDFASQLIVERSLEIVSEASRHLPTEMKQRYPEIPWKDIANIGNKLRHEYRHIEQSTIWHTATLDVPILEKVCTVELDRERQLGVQPQAPSQSTRSKWEILIDTAQRRADAERLSETPEQRVGRERQGRKDDDDDDGSRGIY